MAAPMENMIVLTVLAFISLTAGFEDEFEGSRTLSLEHSFDQGLDPVFTKRGTLVIKSVQSKRATFSQSAPLSKDDRQLLRSTVDDDGMYRVRIPIRETEEGTVYVSSFTRACAIYESSLSDTLIVSVDQSGEVLGVSMATTGNCEGLQVPTSNLTDWRTRVELSVTVTGPAPDTQSYIEKLKREEQEKTKGGKSDDRSFFAKYWMYIVPFVIIMFVMQSMDPNQGGGGGGGS
ncbi:ER membrane protein complex subunit 10-like [Mya arenaria]|uniref:ER membrane protein complex subunit 10-like n=1 Tax=Mya arenaria TaxID=6604 RepID=UPI0022E49048|nr:ER membrane protein complex subunit 10-like [Mya arenaria]XP_052798095.1 ER membrane protein complex subunit 10-like [Mya arenaria]